MVSEILFKINWNHHYATRTYTIGGSNSILPPKVTMQA